MLTSFRLGLHFPLVASGESRRNQAKPKNNRLKPRGPFRSAAPTAFLSQGVSSFLVTPVSEVHARFAAKQAGQ